MKNRGLVFLLIAGVLSGCATGRSMPERSLWRGTVELPEGITVPFRMSLDFSGINPAGYFLVGDEQTPVPEISRRRNSITLGFSEYSAEVQATWNGSQLVGSYLRIRPDGTKSFRFTAVPETDSSNESDATATNATLPSGNYQVVFEDKETDDTTVAKFWDKEGAVFGTFIAPDGDYGLLVGRPSGARLQLSRFTGWQAIAIVLEPEGEKWSGKFHAAHNAAPRAFVLQPRAGLEVDLPATKHTTMKDPDSAFTFSGLSLSGDTVRHTDDRFKGKALIVDIMGTWCHNCLDEAPVLQRLQEQYGKDGLEIVGLSFELTDDSSLARKNLQLYKDRFGLTFTLLFCGSTDDENVKRQLESQLNNFFAYPTAIFIDKKGKVQAIHSGFKGPGTGDEFKAQIREFHDLTSKLVR